MQRFTLLENFVVKVTPSGGRKERQNEGFWGPRRDHKHSLEGLLQSPLRKRCFENQHKDSLFSGFFSKRNTSGSELPALLSQRNPSNHYACIELKISSELRLNK